MPEDTVFAVASGKGGVGKTTTTVNVGTAFAGAGYEVAVVDTDLGMANLAGFVNLSPADATLHEVLAGTAQLEEATYEVADGISAVPSGADLETYADIDAGELESVVDQLRESFDFVILDVGAGVSYESVMPLGLADSVVIVATPEPAAIQDASKTVDLVARADGEVSGLVLTRVRPETDVSYGELSHRIDLPLLGKIPEDEAVRESLYSGTPIVAYDPESPASLAYRNLASTLVKGIPEPTHEPAIGADTGSRPHKTESSTSGDDSRRAAATDGEGMAATSHGTGEAPPEPASDRDFEGQTGDHDSAAEEANDHGVTFSEPPEASTSPGAGADQDDTGINLDPVADDSETQTTEQNEPQTTSELTEDAIPFQGESRPLEDEESSVTFEPEDGAEEDTEDAEDDDDDDDEQSGGLFSRLFG